MLYALVQCPTTIVPFLGDQPFWGDRVHANGVGPPPIPVDEFSLDKLIDAINFMLDPKVQCALELAKAMENEGRVTEAVNAFHTHYVCRKTELELVKSHDSSHFSIERRFGKP